MRAGSTGNALKAAKFVWLPTSGVTSDSILDNTDSRRFGCGGEEGRVDPLRLLWVVLDLRGGCELKLDWIGEVNGEEAGSKLFR